MMGLERSLLVVLVSFLFLLTHFWCQIENNLLPTHLPTVGIQVYCFLPSVGALQNLYRRWVGNFSNFPTNHPHYTLTFSFVTFKTVIWLIEVLEYKLGRWFESCSVKSCRWVARSRVPTHILCSRVTKILSGQFGKIFSYVQSSAVQKWSVPKLQNAQLLGYNAALTVKKFYFAQEQRWMPLKFCNADRHQTLKNTARPEQETEMVRYVFS